MALHTVFSLEGSSSLQVACLEKGRQKRRLTVGLATMLLLVCFCAKAGISGSQNKLTLDVKNASLESVLKEIEKQTGYQYVMQDQWKNIAKRIDISVEDKALIQVLDEIFKDQPFTYEIVQKIIVVKQNAKNVLNTPPFNADDSGAKDLQGIVTSEKGEPLAGATVYIRELNISGVTNAKGEFELKSIPNGKYRMVVTYVGYEKVIKEVVITENRIKLFLQLKQSSAVLDESIVKGYYTTSNRLNLGNATVVKGEEIAKQPVTDPLMALEGRVPGLYISQLSGVPGASSTVMLRGLNSIPDVNIKLSTVNDPLYIVDGVPYSSASLTGSLINSGAAGSPSAGTGPGLSPFNNLNPSDIESITVLKDAEATAIYGSRGANGVILITTKKGVAGQTKLTFNIYTGVGKVTRKLNLLNTPQYLEMRREGIALDGYTPDSTYDFDLTNWDTTRYTDWQKALIGNSSRFTNAQLSLSGGDIHTQFLLSGTMSDQGTLFPGNFDDRKVSVYSNINHTSSNQKFHAQFTASYVNDINTLPDIDLTTYITLAPDAPSLYLANGNINWQILNGTKTWQNPIAYTLRNDKGSTDNLVSNLVMGYRLFPGFDLKTSLGYSHTQLNQIDLGPASFYPPPASENPFSRSNVVGTTDNTSWIIEPQMAYQRKIKKGTLDVLFGTTFQENENQSVSYSASGFSSDNLISNISAGSTFGIVGNTYSKYDYNAFFGRIGFNWDDKYLISLTGRRDGSSRFGPGRQFGNFGAAALGWIFSKESFVQNNFSFLSFGKLRGSYGITGNDGLSDYSFLSTYSVQSTTYQGTTGLYPTRLNNPIIAWESVKKLEMGLDLGFLHDRVLATGSWYRNRTDNQLVNAQQPFITGFSGVVVNLPALLQNSGLEFTLTTINVRSKNFSWNSAFNISFPQNKLVAFPNFENSPYKNVYTVGKSLFSSKVFHYTGVNPQTGLYSFATKNPNGIPDAPQDWIVSKPVTQKYFGGLMNSLSYHGFQLDIFFQFVKQLGHSYLRDFDMPGVFNANQPTEVLGRWQNPGDISNTQKYSSFNLYQTFNYLKLSDGVITDASFIRLKNISLSYQLPKNLLHNIYLNNVLAYIRCQNLFTITKYKGLDPETQGLNLPPLRMIVTGIQITL